MRRRAFSIRKFATTARRLIDGFVEWADARWYMTGLLFPALVLAIMLGLVAGLGSSWLWPVVFLIAVPALVVVFFTKREGFTAAKPGWHLR